jgi:hypothetical protein
MGKLIETVNCVGIIIHHTATRNNICSIQSQVLQLLVLRNAGMQLLFLRANRLKSETSIPADCRAGEGLGSQFKQLIHPAQVWKEQQQ